jgi:predicted Zn-dependent peptidase
VVQIANGPASEDDDRYTGRILATVVGDDSGSRMFWELVDPGFAECATMGAYEYQGTGILLTYLCCAPEDTAANFARIQQIFAEAEAAGISEAELAQAKSKIRSHVVLQSERPTNRMFTVGSSWIARRQYRTVREVLESYNRVSCEDVAALLKTYPLSVNTTVAVGPLTEDEQLVIGR